MQPFWFIADPTFDAAALASEVGATWDGLIARRAGGAVGFHVRPEGDHVLLTISAASVWPWRWPAAKLLEEDLLRGFAHRGIRGADDTSQSVLELAVARRS